MADQGLQPVRQESCPTLGIAQIVQGRDAVARHLPASCPSLDSIGSVPENIRRPNKQTLCDLPLLASRCVQDQFAGSVDRPIDTERSVLAVAIRDRFIEPAQCGGVADFLVMRTLDRYALIFRARIAIVAIWTRELRNRTLADGVTADSASAAVRVRARCSFGWRPAAETVCRMLAAGPLV